MDQRIIDLYDEFTHRPLPRRVFMERLIALAGSASAATAALGVLRPDYASAAIVADNDPRIAGSDTEIAGTRGYLVTPKGVDVASARAFVIVIHENRGLNPHIRDVARRMATEGYAAFAPDFLTRQGGTPSDEDKAREMFANVKYDSVGTDGAAMIAAIKSRNPQAKVGAMGFCWGGGAVNWIAATSPQLDAGVVFYGVPPRMEDVPKIKAGLMIHLGGLDQRINAMIPPYDAALKAANVPHEIFTYDGANHAFNNDTSAERYNEAAAKLAWSRTLAFFKQRLGA